MKTKDEFINEVLNDPTYIKVVGVISGSDRTTIESTVKDFIDELAWPLLECFSTLATDPELIKALKSNPKK
jgi:hypothetical protein